MAYECFLCGDVEPERSVRNGHVCVVCPNCGSVFERKGHVAQAA